MPRMLEFEKIALSLETVGLARWKRQSRANGRLTETRIVWEMIDREALVFLFKAAVSAAEGDAKGEEITRASMGLSDGQLMPYYRRVLGEDAIALAWRCLCDAEPKLLKVNGETTYATKLLEESLSIQCVDTARNALNVWSELPEDWKRWLWGKVPPHTKKLLSEAAKCS